MGEGCGVGLTLQWTLQWTGSVFLGGGGRVRGEEWVVLIPPIP